MISDKKGFEEIKTIILDNSFWKSVKFLSDKMLLPAKELISKFESDKTCLSTAYQSYFDTYIYYQKLETNEICDPEKLSELFLQNWNYSHMDCGGFAHILAPRNYSSKMMGTD